MTKHAQILIKIDATTKQVFTEKLKTEGKTTSQWLRQVINRYVKKTPQKGES